MKDSRIQRTRSDLALELIDQISILNSHCRTYDSGTEVVAKHIATSLRVLLHQSGRSLSLLDQLGLRNKRFADTGGKFDPNNLLTISTLLSFQIGPSGSFYRPLSANSMPPPFLKFIPFSDWWGATVIRDNKMRELSRRELVANVADTDGGAHVDPTLTETYMDFSRNNSLGWVTVGADGSSSPLQGRPELACIRQIAEEVLMTLGRTFPQGFNA